MKKVEINSTIVYNIQIDGAYSYFERSMKIMKNKHLSFDDRLEIEKGLNENLSFKQIEKNIGKDCATVSKEIKNHIIFKNSDAIGRLFFDCVNRCNCPHKGTKCKEKILNIIKKKLVKDYLKHLMLLMAILKEEFVH